MSGEQLAARSATVTLMYDGWQVWDGQFGELRQGSIFVGSVEFVQRSPLRVAQLGAAAELERIRANWYRATAKVLETAGAVVLDLGAFRAVRWVRPGESPGEFAPGATVALDLSLGLNPWNHAPWTSRAAALYGVDHRWRINRILRYSSTDSGSDAVELDAATMDTVDSAGQYCLLDCAVMRGTADHT